MDVHDIYKSYDLICRAYIDPNNWPFKEGFEPLPKASEKFFNPFERTIFIRLYFNLPSCLVPPPFLAVFVVFFCFPTASTLFSHFLFFCICICVAGPSDLHFYPAPIATKIFSETLVRLLGFLWSVQNAVTAFVVFVVFYVLCFVITVFVLNSRGRCKGCEDDQQVNLDSLYALQVHFWGLSMPYRWIFWVFLCPWGPMGHRWTQKLTCWE